MDLSERPEQPTRRHPWEVSRFNFLSNVLGTGLANAQLTRSLDVLDAGSGDGWFGRQLCCKHVLPGASTVTCWDDNYSPKDLDTLRAKTPSAVDFTSRQPQRNFDVVLLLDVLEHIEDDAAFLRRLVTTNLVPGGFFLLSVPAIPALYGRHDIALRHFRRYRPSGARRVLKEAGLKISTSGGLFHSLLVPRIIQRPLEFLSGHRDDLNFVSHELSWTHGPVLTAVVGGVLTLDNWISRIAALQRTSLPGLSFWALCRNSPGDDGPT